MNWTGKSASQYLLQVSFGQDKHTCWFSSSYTHKSKRLPTGFTVQTINVVIELCVYYIRFDQASRADSKDFCFVIEISELISLSRDRLSILKFPRLFSDYIGRRRNITSRNPTSASFRIFANHYSQIMPSFDATWSDIQSVVQWTDN
jgi:hypothetical protein